MYGFPDDDRLNDGISSICMISQSAGGIIGPLAGGLYIDYFSTDSLYVVAAFITLGYCFAVLCIFLAYRSIKKEEIYERLLEKE